MQYKVLTLTQPWATLIAIGAKHIETRSWATSYRGPLLIHAGQGLGKFGTEAALWDCALSEPFRTALASADIWNPARLPRGAIVAVCRIAHIGETTGTGYRLTDLSAPLAVSLPSQERAFGDYTPGRYAWLLADVRRLPEPIPAKGQLGLWTWEGELPL